jgi:hypothetical protein
VNALYYTTIGDIQSTNDSVEKAIYIDATEVATHLQKH